MSLTTGRTKLKQSYQALGELWEQTADDWDDSVRKQFGKDHIEPLAPEVTAALRAIDRLDVVLHRMKSDCS